MMRTLIVGLALISMQAAGQSKRQDEIARTAAAIEQECARYGGGDWQRWFEKLAAYRDEVSALLDDAYGHPRVSPDGKDKVGLLKATGTPPLFVECLSAGYLCLWRFHDRTNHETFLKERLSPSIIADVSRWLAMKNIDLIFVPVPKMGEVYPDRMAQHVPPDRIVAPHVRRMVLELLRSNVEVVDLLPEFLKAREEDPDPLYYPGDPHWNDRAQRIAAREIVRRLERYAFVQAAKVRTPQYKAVEIVTSFRGVFWNLLTKEEQDEIGNGVVSKSVRVIRRADNSPATEVEDSPVLVMGDSYTNYTDGAVCHGCGVLAHIAHGINQPISLLAVSGGRTEPIKELLRNQDLLEKRKVVIWIIQNASFTNDWPALPAFAQLAGRRN
jgi:hypothetical protein